MIVVSICMITFNHENYIREAINGVLMQETNFEYELIISNDCSTDKTHNVINNILKNHPKSSTIKYIHHKENIGMMSNFISTLKACKGQYIAICDGDDYWTDTKKLQKQVDFLDDHPEFNLVYTLHKTLFNNKKLVINQVNQINRKVTTVKDLVKENFITASSTMFRNIIQNMTFPNWFYSSPYGDWPFYMLITQNGEKIKCLLNYTLVYRKAVGVMSKMNMLQILENNYNLFTNILNDKNLEFIKKDVYYKLYIIDIQLMKYFNRDKKYLQAFKKLKNILKFKLDEKQLPKPVLKMYIKSIIEGYF